MTASAAADTIAAVATPPGHGAVGIVRVSGPRAATVAGVLLGALPPARRAVVRTFRDRDGAAIDRGLVLWFPGPDSYTGEDTLELHGHGGPAVMDAVLARVLELGARAARPGEFTERAFLNGRLDLAQAEAVADLIETADAAGARAAMRSLEGAFSDRVHTLVDQLIDLRAWIEAALDFPDEEIDFLADRTLHERLAGLRHLLAQTRSAAAEGRRLVEGLTLVIAGAPNVGKSSLLNLLAGTDAAIVTDVAGTTRDLLRERIRIAGVPLTAIDTAGLRATRDPVESEGVRRAHAALSRADRILLVVDAADPGPWPSELPDGIPIDLVRNKVDLTGEPAGVAHGETGHAFNLSAVTGAGVDALRAHLRQVLGGTGDSGVFSARRRHIEALDEAGRSIERAAAELDQSASGELAAECLRQAQHALGRITGTVTTEDLLGEIFSRFCIGK